MKKVVNIVVLLVLFAFNAHGQHGKALKRVHAAQISYITDRMSLTREQSAAFLPVYSEYEQERRSIRRSYRAESKALQSEDGEEARQYIENNLDYQEDIITLKRKYNKRFLEVISPGQLKDMYEAEREFRAMLIKRIKQKRSGHYRR